jgi:hypothetical protein
MNKKEAASSKFKNNDHLKPERKGKDVICRR